MKEPRGKCGACGQKTAVRDGQARDGRPSYKCLNGACNQTWTRGLTGEAWDLSAKSVRN